MSITHDPVPLRREGFILRDLSRFDVVDVARLPAVDVARLPAHQSGFKGILANSTTKVLHGVARSSEPLESSRRKTSLPFLTNRSAIAVAFD